ncbi:hypothetical protein FNV58_01225 (plasmid) [Streptomyces sp. RLB1-9]|uniref:hypothetical protein n=1 Tax=Streptomyces sp. RLB1-9 TaxID=2594454 RepID=UPI00116496F9|nr:hypothetical protein [Streptomyces sp. RLB1-9]QDN94983.1 hypothetical protein FNV58_01225 [Streptomyces sp. RLB1-9]
MRLSELKPRELYATKAASRTAARRSTGPALLLDTRLWELNPGPAGTSFFLAPADAQSRSGVQDSSTGARRGMLVIQASPAAAFTKGFDEQAVAEELAVIGQQKDIEKLARLVRRDAIDRVLGDLRENLPASLILNVTPLQALVDPWQAAKKYRCTEAACSAEVSLDAADRVRPHENDQGDRCAASLTHMSAKVRETNLIP